ncbi:MAG: hypothetical protein HY392_00290 [Candidatus Diapherotrites archaeon]|nr:hypothetical protein [Candidatus Diapherotrites archaeon]
MIPLFVSVKKTRLPFPAAGGLEKKAAFFFGAVQPRKTPSNKNGQDPAPLICRFLQYKKTSVDKIKKSSPGIFRLYPFFRC